MSKGRAFGWWFLVLVVLAASTVVAWILGIGLLIYLEPTEIQWAIGAHVNFPPSDLLHIADLFAIFLMAAIWVVPVAWAVGLAIRARTALALLWGFAISLLLTAAFVWFKAQPLTHIFAIAAGVLAIGGIVLLVLRKLPIRALAWIEAGSFCFLFVPSLLALASLPKQPPLARKVWSVVLQKGTWQAMNTGSEFAATRQLTFAGDRIIAVFDAGYPFYKGKEPISRYRVLSLDRSTGVVKNQVEFTGPWGAMPYIFGTKDGEVALVGHGPVELLNPDLSKTGIEFSYNNGRIDQMSPDGTTLGWETSPGLTMLSTKTLQPIAKLSESAPISISQDAAINTNTSWFRDFPNDKEFVTLSDNDNESLLFHGNCGYTAQFLTHDWVLIPGCRKIRVLDRQGKTVVETPNIESGGLFAGVSQNGKRFALEFSDERGDPSVLLYERFVIYDSATATPVASILMGSLPERQSWSAFSSDGRYFAAGNPNQLSLYAIP